MATLVQCPHCGSYNTAKTSNGKLSDALAKTGAVVGGVLSTNIAATTAMNHSKFVSVLWEE